MVSNGFCRIDGKTPVWQGSAEGKVPEVRIELRAGEFWLRTANGDNRVNPLGLRFAGSYEESYERESLEMVARGGWKKVSAGEMAIVELGRVRGLDLDRIEKAIQRQYRRAYYAGSLRFTGDPKGHSRKVA